MFRDTDSCLGIGILHPSFLGLGLGTDPLYAVIHSHCTLHAVVASMGEVVWRMPFG